MSITIMIASLDACPTVKPTVYTICAEVDQKRCRTRKYWFGGRGMLVSKSVSGLIFPGPIMIYIATAALQIMHVVCLDCRCI